MPDSSDISREVLWSCSTLLIFAFIGTLTYHATMAGWTRMYFELPLYGWTWFWTSVALAILLHDTWFYWTHRAMHHPRLFKIFHRVHHQSTNPTPWAAFAFSPLEAVIQGLIVPLVIFLIPIHPIAFLLFSLWQMVLNVTGHTGYEYNRPELLRSRLWKWVNTPTHHALHHEYVRGNYGLYFNFWDRWMGTNQARNVERFEEVTTRLPRPVVPELEPSPALESGLLAAAGTGSGLRRAEPPLS